MHARTRTIRHAAGMAAALLVAACQDSTGPTPPPDVDAVSITAPHTTLNIGDSLQLTGTIRDVNGGPLSGQMAWSSSNSTVASVRASGTVWHTTAEWR